MRSLFFIFAIILVGLGCGDSKQKSVFVEPGNESGDIYETKVLTTTSSVKLVERFELEISSGDTTILNTERLILVGENLSSKKYYLYYNGGYEDSALVASKIPTGHYLAIKALFRKTFLNEPGALIHFSFEKIVNHQGG